MCKRRIAHSRRGGVWCSGTGALVELMDCRLAFNKMSCVSACNGATARALRCSFQHELRSAMFCDDTSDASAVSPPSNLSPLPSLNHHNSRFGLHPPLPPPPHHRCPSVLELTRVRQVCCVVEGSGDGAPAFEGPVAVSDSAVIHSDGEDKREKLD